MLDLSVPLICLALNIYHESRADPLEGQLAVAVVTINRAHRKKNKVCSVVFAKAQFSWTDMEDWYPYDEKAWQRSLVVARLSWEIGDFTRRSTHFHTFKVQPKWSYNKVCTGI